MAGLAFHSFVIVETRDPSLYEKLNVWRDTPNEEIWKKKREALIKYHPDKLKGEEKELYADVFINLNNYFDTITSGKELYDYYNEEKQVEEGPKATEEELPTLWIMKALRSAPFFILWGFIPPSYLHKEKWKSKLVCMFITGLLGGLEFLFIG